LYYPSHGGGDKSNRLLMEALAARGHDVRVVTRVESFGDVSHERLSAQLAERGVRTEGAASDPAAIKFHLAGVDVRTLTRDPALRPFFSRQISDFDPDVILTSTDDPGQLLFDLALRAPRARVVYLVRATIAVPFGPDSSGPSVSKTENLKHADGVVGVSEYVARYVREFGGIPAIHVPISLLEPVAHYPDLGRFDNPYVSMVNPCAVKGICIFLEMADRMPQVQFAAVPTWGATPGDLAALRRRPNITLVGPFDDIDDLLRTTRVILVPSVWAEARSRIVPEAMSRGVPVIAADIGGIPEAHLGVEYLVPVNAIRRYRPALDANLVPIPEVPPQDAGPWVKALDRLLSDPDHWSDVARRSRAAAVQYAAELSVVPFETYIAGLLSKSKKAAPVAAAPMSEEKRKLLALRLKQRTASKPEWFSGLADIRPGALTLFCFPYAGGGAMAYRAWRDSLPELAVVAARLPGRESRLGEPPIPSMTEVVETLGAEILPRLTSGPFAFFGHSMGAIIAFELARWLRARGHAGPKSLHVSAARPPVFRLDWTPGPEPEEAEFLQELRRLEGMPRDVLENPELMRVALPAIRADAALYRQYRYQPTEPLDTPVFAYGGESDPNIRPEHLSRWAEVTSGPLALRMFPGGHFFIQSATREFLQALQQDLHSER
jgi:surfactin synthase thioesterase subunit/glycosyltransferase involved in cell wall biosynthesis